MGYLARQFTIMFVDSEMMLEDYELKLNLFSKFQKRLEIIGNMEKLLIDSTVQTEEVQELLETLKEYM